MFSLNYQILDTSRANPLLSQKRRRKRGKKKKKRQTALEAVLTFEMFFVFFFM